MPFLALINPRIVSESEEQAEFFEGCLSLAGFGAAPMLREEITVDFFGLASVTQRAVVSAASRFFSR